MQCTSAAAAKGYPSIDGTPIPKGAVLIGQLPDNTSVVCAGVSLSAESLVTSGGRVLGVTGIGTTLSEAYFVLMKQSHKST